MEKDKNNLPGYPVYQPEEDIYQQYEEEKDIDPDNVSENKLPLENYGKMNVKDFSEDMTGGDLDVPGSEDDDMQESIGSEDEENNYYSLGGDDHDDDFAS